MTPDRFIAAAFREWAEVLELLGDATPGPWVAGSFFVIGDIKNSSLHLSPTVCGEVSEADAAAIAGAVNFLRNHGSAFMAAELARESSGDGS